MIRVRASDFGPIKHADIQLRPLTVLIGPNNSGKSYFSTLLYALHRALPHPSRFADFGVNFHRRLTKPLSEFPSPFPIAKRTPQKIKVIESTKPWRDSILSRKTPLQFSEIPEELQNYLRHSFDAYWEESASGLSQELSRCFGAQVDDLKSAHSSRSHFEVMIQPGDNSWNSTFALSGHSLKIKKKKFTFENLTIEPPSPQDRAHLFRFDEYEGSQEEAYLDKILYQMIQGVAEPFSSYPYYLPAARSGILHGHKALASFLVRQSSHAGLQEFRIPQMPGVIRDFIGDLIELNARHVTKLGSVARELESRILHGRITIQSGKIEYPEIFYESPNGKFLIHRTSSMVSELAPVLLYLKHVLEPDNLLLIEEPESHLHPGAQRILALCIVRLLRRGLRIVLTTHSDYLLAQLSHFVQLASHDAVIREKEGYLKKDFIAPDNIAVYAFSVRSETGMSTSRQVDVTSEGIPEVGFEEVMTSLYEQSSRLRRYSSPK